MRGLRHRSRSSGIRSVLRAFAVLLLYVAPAAAIEKPESELAAAGIDFKLGGAVDTGVMLRGTDGTIKPMRDWVTGRKPLLLAPVYYRCPRVCGLMLTGLARFVEETDLRLGDDFEVVTVSVDPAETPEAAAEKEAASRAKVPAGKGDPSAWKFFVADRPSVESILRATGFGFVPDKGEFAHSPGLVVLTPDGGISQYFTGISFPAWDVKMALVEASQGRVGSAIDHVLLFCYRFDPTKGRYTIAAWNVVRAGVVLFILGFVAVAYRSIRRGRYPVVKGKA